MKNNPLPRLDEIAANHPLRRHLEKSCRLKPGEIWQDPHGKHRIACIDCTNAQAVRKMMGRRRAQAAIHDPPYNLVCFKERSIDAFIAWCRQWISISEKVLDENASLYIWLGADQKNGFQPLADFMIMMRSFKAFQARSFISMRNQRGYGTQKNWMAVRQELLFLYEGRPLFSGAVYRDSEDSARLL